MSSAFEPSRSPLPPPIAPFKMLSLAPLLAVAAAGVASVAAYPQRESCSSIARQDDRTNSSPRRLPLLASPQPHRRLWPRPRPLPHPARHGRKVLPVLHRRQRADPNVGRPDRAFQPPPSPEPSVADSPDLPSPRSTGRSRELSSPTVTRPRRSSTRSTTRRSGLPCVWCFVVFVRDPDPAF